MIGVIIIAVVFTGLAIAIAYGASKGVFKGLSNALQSSNRGSARALYASLVVVYIGGILALPAVFILGNRNKSNAQVGGVKLTANMQVGRELFAEHCGVCHTLAATNSVGKVGPNLDALKPTKSLTLHTIANGCLQAQVGKDYNTICLGYGTMPADLVEGQEAQDVAEFVSKVAGHT